MRGASAATSHGERRSATGRATASTSDASTGVTAIALGDGPTGGTDAPSARRSPTTPGSSEMRIPRYGRPGDPSTTRASTGRSTDTRSDRAEKVYKPDIVNNPGKLYKQ